MNYIKHINWIFDLFHKDSNLNPTHISLYMALFREWNKNRFSDQFSVSRSQLMKTAKIGSKSTYHRCISDLDEWDYISYHPSRNPHKGSEVQMANFHTDTVPSEGQDSPKSSGQVEHYRPKSSSQVGHYNPNSGGQVGHYSPNTVPVTIYKHVNMIKQINMPKHANPENDLEVINFFKNENKTEDEALHFFNYYQSKGWKVGDNTNMKDWKAVAKSWIRKTGSSKTFNDAPRISNRDNLKTNQIKDYGQPL